MVPRRLKYVRYIRELPGFSFYNAVVSSCNAGGSAWSLTWSAVGRQGSACSGAYTQENDSSRTCRHNTQQRHNVTMQTLLAAAAGVLFFWRRKGTLFNRLSEHQRALSHHTPKDCLSCKALPRSSRACVAPLELSVSCHGSLTMFIPSSSSS